MPGLGLSICRHDITDIDPTHCRITDTKKQTVNCLGYDSKIIAIKVPTCPLGQWLKPHAYSFAFESRANIFDTIMREYEIDHGYTFTDLERRNLGQGFQGAILSYFFALAIV